MNAIVLAFMAGSIVGGAVVSVVTLSAVREAQRTAETYFQAYLQVQATRNIRARLSQDEREGNKSVTIVSRRQP